MAVADELRISEAPWNGDAGRFTDEQWQRACALDRKSGEPPKSRCSLPYMTPGGEISRAGVRAAAVAIVQERASDSMMSEAKAKLRAAYSALGEKLPESIRASDSKKSEEDILGSDRLFERYGATPGVARHGQEGILGGIPFEVRAADGGEALGILHGHFAVFNRWTEIDSFFEGRFLESIAPGAFKKTFQENGNSIRCLFQHGRDPQIGMKPLGAPRDLGEDDEGARYEVPLFDASYVRDLVPGLKSGQFGASFRFRVLREEVNAKPERSDHNPEGIEERTITECLVREFGPVTFPAYPDATAGVRSLVEDCLRDEVGEAGYAALTRSARYYTELLGITRSAAAAPEATRNGDGDGDGEPSDEPSSAPDGKIRTTRLTGSHAPLRTSREVQPPWKL